MRCTCIRSRKPISAGRHCGGCGSLFLRIILQPLSWNRYTLTHRYRYILCITYCAHDDYNIIITHYVRNLVLCLCYKNICTTLFYLYVMTITTATERNLNQPRLMYISCIPMTWLLYSTYLQTILLLCHGIPSIDDNIF